MTMNQNGDAQPDVKTIRLSPASTPGYTHAPGLTEESAKRASELLTLNHDLYHTRFNGGLHSKISSISGSRHQHKLTFCSDHIVHHLLAIWALGGSPDEIQAMWDYNISYQAPLEPIVADLIDLKDPVRFKECIGKDECYYDFLRFFEDEVAEKGVPAVVNEYVFKGDERADDIFCRMFTGNTKRSPSLSPSKRALTTSNQISSTPSSTSAAPSNSTNPASSPKPSQQPASTVPGPKKSSSPPKPTSAPTPPAPSPLQPPSSTSSTPSPSTPPSPRASSPPTPSTRSPTACSRASRAPSSRPTSPASASPPPPPPLRATTPRQPPCSAPWPT